MGARATGREPDPALPAIGQNLTPRADHRIRGAIRSTTNLALLRGEP